MLAAMTGLAARIRARPVGLAGTGGESISSLGAIGGEGSTLIVNPPEAAILGTNRVETRPVRDGEALCPGRKAALDLSHESCVISGADAPVS